METAGKTLDIPLARESSPAYTVTIVVTSPDLKWQVLPWKSAGRRRAVAGHGLRRHLQGGVTASTEVWNRGMRAEDSKSLVNPLETKCNCGTAACTRRLNNGDASPQSALDRG